MLELAANATWPILIYLLCAWSGLLGGVDVVGTVMPCLCDPSAGTGAQSVLCVLSYASSGASQPLAQQVF